MEDKIQLKFGDPDFFLTGDVDRYEGFYTVFDSLITISKDTIPSFKYTYDTTTTDFRQYLVKRVNDTIYTTFNIHALNTSEILSPNKLNSDGWYVGEGGQFKFGGNSLTVKGDFEVPPYANGKWLKRSIHYVGIKQ